MDLEIKAFSELDLEDTFFDSLKNSYPEFTDWFQKKGSVSQSVFEAGSLKPVGLR